MYKWVSAYMYTTRVSGVQGGQKIALESLELELQIVVK